jgi:general secretion pathway protein N
MSLRLSETTIPRWLQISLMIIVVIGIVIWQFPVKWLNGSLSSGTRCKIMLADPSGTLWQGSTAIGFSEPSLDGQSCRPPQAMTERLYWTTGCNITTRTCSVRIEASTLLKPVTASISLAGVRVQDSEIRLPSEILEVMGAPWTILHPRGDLTLRWSTLNFSQQGNTGNIHADLDSLSSPISLIRPLGSYSLDASLSASGVSYTLSTTEGPLILEAQGQIGNDGKASGQGEASATPESQEALNGLLGLIGRRQGNTYKLIF